MTDIIADFIAVIGVATGAGALVQARRANRIAQEAKDGSLALETRMQHIGLTPRIEVTWREPWDADSDHAIIEVKLVGPDGLDRLNTVEVFVRDDQERYVGQQYMGGPTQADLFKQVWGPYRFQPGVDNAPADGRRIPAFALNRGATQKLAMERTQPPHWSQEPTDPWRRRHQDEPVRLTFVCRLAEKDPWSIPMEVVRESDRVSRSWSA